MTSFYPKRGKNTTFCDKSSKTTLATEFVSAKLIIFLIVPLKKDSRVAIEVNSIKDSQQYAESAHQKV